MKKLILSASLVAGTSVGAGMIALPMVLCKIGILPTIALILTMWFFMYLSGLLGLELNLRAGKGLTLGELGHLYRGPITSHIGSLSLMFLIYALLCAYLYGGASIFQSFFEMHLGASYPLKNIVVGYALILALILSFSVFWVLQINKIFLMILLGTFGLLVFCFFKKVDLLHLPIFAQSIGKLDAWTSVLPILFTAFGFQVIFHTLTNFCNRDPRLLKRAVFWGSLIPAVVYILWTMSTLGILYHNAPQKYYLLTLGKLDVGQFVQALTETTAWPLVQTLASVISMIAILKSSLGVGLGLFEFWQEKTTKYSVSFFKAKGVSLGLTIMPPLIISLFVSELFLKALSFAGMVLVIIAIFLPLWLINSPKARKIPPFYPLIENKGLQFLFLMLGFVVVLFELINMMS